MPTTIFILSDDNPKLLEKKLERLSRLYGLPIPVKVELKPQAEMEGFETFIKEVLHDYSNESPGS